MIHPMSSPYINPFLPRYTVADLLALESSEPSLGTIIKNGIAAFLGILPAAVTLGSVHESASSSSSSSSSDSDDSSNSDSGAGGGSGGSGGVPTHVIPWTMADATVLAGRKIAKGGRKKRVTTQANDTGTELEHGDAGNAGGNGGGGGGSGGSATAAAAATAAATVDTDEAVAAAAAAVPPHKVRTWLGK